MSNETNQQEELNDQLKVRREKMEQLREKILIHSVNALKERIYQANYMRLMIVSLKKS